MGAIKTVVGAAMRRRDDRLIRAAFEWWDFDGSYGCVDDWDGITDEDRAHIIAQAEADQ